MGAGNRSDQGELDVAGLDADAAVGLQGGEGVDEGRVAQAAGLAELAAAQRLLGATEGLEDTFDGRARLLGRRRAPSRGVLVWHRARRGTLHKLLIKLGHEFSGWTEPDALSLAGCSLTGGPIAPVWPLLLMLLGYKRRGSRSLACDVLRSAS
jgi:hypothetical protein